MTNWLGVSSFDDVRRRQRGRVHPPLLHVHAAHRGEGQQQARGDGEVGHLPRHRLGGGRPCAARGCPCPPAGPRGGRWPARPGSAPASAARRRRLGLRRQIDQLARGGCPRWVLPGDRPPTSSCGGDVQHRRPVSVGLMVWWLVSVWVRKPSDGTDPSGGPSSWARRQAPPPRTDPACLHPDLGPRAANGSAIPPGLRRGAANGSVHPAREPAPGAANGSAMPPGCAVSGERIVHPPWTERERIRHAPREPGGSNG